jgi:DNA repair exonuclease SbcCD ATPase subunit
LRYADEGELVKILSAKYKNLFSIGEVQIDLSSRGLVLVTGESRDEGGANGSGKSSVSSKGVIWALYGTTSGGLRAGKVVNRHGGKSALGEVEFVDSSGNKWLVRRQRPQKLELFKNGEDVSSKDTKETQASIDTAIGMNRETFVQTCHFGQGRAQSYAGLTAKDQKALLEQILPMEEIEEWSRYATAQLKVLKGKKDTASTMEITAHGIVTERTVQLRSTERSSEAWDLESGKRLTDLQHQRNVVENGLTDQNERLAWTRQQLDEIDMDTLAAEQVVLEDAMEDAKQAELLASLKVRECQDSKSKWNDAEMRLQKRVDDLRLSTVCPTCERGYGKAKEEIVLKSIEGLERKRADAIRNMGEANNALNYYVDHFIEMKAQNTRVEQEFDAVGAKLGEAMRWTNMIEQMERELKDAITPINIRIEEAEKEINPFIDSKFAAGESLTTAEREWENARVVMVKLNAETAHLEYWETVYAKELKLKMFEECCAFLDASTIRHLKGLRNEQFNVTFSTVKRLADGSFKDEFAVTVQSMTGGGEFESLSGGEQQMVSFAIGLALADLASCKTAAKPEFLILDEPFSELDERNSEAIVDYLTGDFGKDRDTLLLISNEESLNQARGSYQCSSIA